jgi:hypothetical protein
MPTTAVSVPAPIPDLDTLKAQVALWLDRDDLETQIPVFIQMFEAEANRDLRTPEMEITVTFSVADEDTPLPDDYLAMRAVYLENGTADAPLRGMSPTALKMDYAGSTGTPQAYALVSGGIRVAPPPADEELFTMDYYGQIEPLSVVAPSNWLLEKHPDAYLYGTLFYAESYLDNAVRAGQWRGMLDMTFEKINRASRGDRYGAGPLVPNATRQVRGARC